jgi:hypothetical protein
MPDEELAAPWFVTDLSRVPLFPPEGREPRALSSSPGPEAVTPAPASAPVPPAIVIQAKAQPGGAGDAAEQAQEQEKEQADEAGERARHEKSFAGATSPLPPPEPPRDGAPGGRKGLAIGKPDDALEVDADRAAERVMGSAEPMAARDGAAARPAGDAIRRTCATCKEEDELQRKAEGGSSAGVAPRLVHDAIRSPGQPIDAHAGAFMQRRFGYDFSGVRIHADAQAAASARAVNALAYTVGRDVVFGAGRYQPDSPGGRRLLAHELAHVVQQRGGAATLRRAIETTTVARMSRDQLFGDGTLTNAGINLEAFQIYLKAQADWFTETSLTPKDRDALWKLATMLQEGDHIITALGKLSLDSLTLLSDDETKAVRKYADGARTTPDTVRIVRPDSVTSRVVALGKAMLDLALLVPGDAVRVVFDQTFLETLVDKDLVPFMLRYCLDFTPTFESPDEQAPILDILKDRMDGIERLAPLKGWVHDPHMFTPATRATLVKNVLDTSRAKPVLLVLMSGLDWNAAFLQSKNIADTVQDPHNLGLVVQGPASLVDEKTWVDKVANDYGQFPPGADKTDKTQARIGQVVIAGHGNPKAVEQATPGTVNADKTTDKSVTYNEDALRIPTPGDASEQLIDEMLLRMDPKNARVVFAGCLVGAHDIPESATPAGVAPVAADIVKALKDNPNLKDVVNSRLEELHRKGTVQAANATTTIDSLNVDPSGKAGVSSPQRDPAISGSKADYVKAGIEPEGALRAALETWVDPKLGPEWTTQAMRDRVASTAASKEWFVSLVRTAFQLALPASGNVQPSAINDLAHRVSAWLLVGWADTGTAPSLAENVKPSEAPVVFPVMLASDRAPNLAHMQVVVQEAWMLLDATHEAQYKAALDATKLKRSELAKQIPTEGANVKAFFDHLGGLMTVPAGQPSRGQLLLALTLAVGGGAGGGGGGIPDPVKNMLRHAAGDRPTKSFPEALHVPDLLEGASELAVLQNIGLAPGDTAAGAAGGPPDEPKANVSANRNQTNETFVKVAPRLVSITGPPIQVFTKPDEGSPVLDTFHDGDQARVVGTTVGWTVIDRFGKMGFVNKIFP